MAFVNVPTQNSGKIKVGQEVILKLDDFPFQEFGSLKRFVTQISPTPNLKVHRITISLPNGLVSNYRKKLRFKPDMTASAEIITEDLRVLERMLYGLRKLVVR